MQMTGLSGDNDNRNEKNRTSDNQYKLPALFQLSYVSMFSRRKLLFTGPVSAAVTVLYALDIVVKHGLQVTFLQIPQLKLQA